MKKGFVAAARRGAVVLILACAGPAMAAVQMLLPIADTNKAARVQPADIRSTAFPVRFNAAELQALPLGSEVQLSLPNATAHTFVFDQKKDHGNGIVTWIGYYRDQDQRLKLRAIVTTGPDGSIGSIQTPAGEFSIRQGTGGDDWLVDLTAEKPRVDLAHDTRQISLSPMKKSEPLASPEFAEVLPGLNVPLSSALPSSAQQLKTAVLSTVDLLLVYNDSLAASVNINTFAAQLISEANTAYADSGVTINLRLAGTMLYSYSDTPDNGAVLDDITGFNSATGTSVATAAHTAIETRRTQVSADLVAFYRGGAGITGDGFGGSGLAWAPNSPMGPAWKPFMYSATVGCWAGCEYIWIHEVGHNMGNMHDRATNAWETGNAPQDSSNQGSYPYSWGFYSCNGRYDGPALTCNPFTGSCTTSEPNCKPGTTNNFKDLMAYFHGSSTTLLRQFSNPNLTCTGSNPALPCGVADASTDPLMPGRQDSADLARSMNANAVALSGLNGPPSGGNTGTPTTTTVTSGYNPAQVGSSFAFTATVTSQTGTPTGTVTFRWNGNVVDNCGAINIDGAGHSFCGATNLPAGALSITAQYNATGSFAGSTSTILTQNMVPVPRPIGTAPRKVDFNGDGKSDLAWKGPTADVWGVWLMAGASYGPTSLVAPPRSGSTLHATGDFDGDGKTDLLWCNTDGTYTVMLMSGTTAGLTGTVGGPNSGLDVIGVGDFNGDGKADLLWASLAGGYYVTLMNGTASIGTTALVPPAPPFFPAFIGDFSGDLHDDVLWRSLDGSLIVTLLNGTTNIGQAQLLPASTGWFPTHVADFNGDGRADIVLGKGDGSAALWLMSGGSIIGSSVLQNNNGVPNGWSVAFARDLDGDGKADLIWANTNGTYGAWLMNGAVVKPNGYGTLFGVTNSGWAIASVGDYNADGKWDLLWRKNDGTYSTWIMNGLAPSSYGTVLNGGTGWEIAP